MVHRDGKFKNHKYTLERFETINEFIREMEARPITPQYKDNHTARSVRSYIEEPGWAGASTYEEAKDMFLNGTKAKAEMRKAFASEIDPHRKKIETGICGCAPIVPNALLGIPQAMIDVKHRRVPKAIRVVVNMSISASTSAREITEAGKKIIAAVGKLESQGVSTEILCTSDKEIGHGREQVISSCSIAIKNAGQAFNAARVSFSMSSPAFLRVFQFIHTSSQPEIPYDGGYGRAISYGFSREELSEYYRTMYGNGVYISLADVTRYGQSEIDRAINAWKSGK